MCGIAGIFSARGIDPNCLRAMSSAIAHRGPNGFGTLLHSDKCGMKVWHNADPAGDVMSGFTAGLAFRRLSIIDLSEGNMQPMTDHAGTIGLAYNGEIYNYLELRQELETLGYPFRTSGDTEVLLNAYRAWGVDCVRRFNGMWAFVILDVQKQQVILSRDRFGIKPLYFTIRDKTLYIASEIKGILAVPTLTFLPNEKTVADYLSNGKTDTTNQTFFEGVESFPAAHVAVIPLKVSQLAVHAAPYWSFPNTTFKGSEAQAVETFRSLLYESVRFHGRSDMPIGTCLSGGMDSSSIVCIMRQVLNGSQIPNNTHEAFGYCPGNEKYSEKLYMQLVANTANFEMHFIDVTDEELAIHLPSIIAAQDEPFGSASVAAQWFVFRRCHSEGMTVMMDGQGADEVLGGYPYYFATIAARYLARLDLRGYRALRVKYEEEIGPFPASTRSLLISLLPAALRQLGRTLRRTEQNCLTPHLISLLSAATYKSNRDRTLTTQLQYEMRSLSLPALLRYEDRNSMAHSVEARVPFLDTRFVDFVFSLPDHYKIRDLSMKYILQQAMKGIVPEPILARKEKIGFRADPGLTLRLLKDKGNEYVQNRSEWERRWFNQDGVERVFAACGESASTEFQAWRVLNTKLWARQFWP